MSGIKRLSRNPLLYLIFRPLASNALGLSQKTPTVCNTFPEIGFEGQALRKALTLTNPQLCTLPSQTVSSLDVDRPVIV